MYSISLCVRSNTQLEKHLEKQELGFSSAILIQLFSSQSPKTVQGLSRTLHRKWPDAVIIGASAQHMIHDGVIERGATQVVITRFDHATLTYASAPNASGAQGGESLSHSLSLSSETKAILCFVDRLTAKGNTFFRCFDSSDIPVAGGASTITEQGRWVLLNGECYQECSVAVAIHSTKLHVWRSAFSEWNAIGQRFKVTQTSNNTVYTLNHQNITELYQRYLADGQQLPQQKLFDFPLIKGDPTHQDVYLPQYVDENSGLVFDKALSVGDEVQFCYVHPELTIHQVQDSAYHLAQQQPDAIFVFNCTSRLDFIEGNQELAPLQQVAPTYGFYCMGELYKEESTQEMLHHSMTYLAMREGDASGPVPSLTLDNTSSVSPLFSMIRNAFADLDTRNLQMQHKIQSQAEELASSYRIDHTTGLPNRSVLRQQLAKIGDDQALFTLKLANLPEINEKYGYAIGDRLLVLLTSFFIDNLDDVFADNATLYSLGVGEWATIFTLDKQIDSVRERYYRAIKQIEHFDLDHLGIVETDHIAVSICAGVVYRRDFPHCSPDELLFKSVDARRYAIKHHRYLYNASNLISQDQERQVRLKQLSVANSAINQHQVVPFVQPIFDAKTREAAFYECLVRLQHQGEIVSPGLFLPHIQGTRLYTKMSRQMIKHTFAKMRENNDIFSLNLSPQDLLDDRTLALLEQEVHSLADPSRAGIEIVESEQIRNFARMREVCDHFRAMGVAIIVDDFGSGYSNLDEIIKLEPSVIKLDGSLIRTIDQDAKQRKIASQLVRLCEVFDAKTVAEFVHNEQVCQIATDIGIDYLQGFHLGEPRALD